MISKIIVFLSIFHRSLGKFLANPTLNSRGRAENAEERNFPLNMGFSEIFFFLDFCLEKIKLTGGTITHDPMVHHMI